MGYRYLSHFTSSYRPLTLEFLERYALDLDVYHQQVKPIFITGFKAAFNAFISKYGAFRSSATFGLTFLTRCGNNPDFEIDRNGIVNPNAIRGRDLCTRVAYKTVY
jgi:hypothetical protein